MGAIKQVWSVFNHWRKRYWLSRVLILVIIVSFRIYNAPILPQLVRIACSAILANAEPKMQDAIYRSNKANATRRLQAALKAKLDVNGDGLLNDDEHESARAIGLDPVQLERPPLRADLEELAAAARHAHLIAPSYTARAIRKDAWRLASLETEEIMAPERAKIDELMVWYRVPDLTDPSAWANGASLLLRTVYFLLFRMIGNPSHWVPFFVVVYLGTALLGMWFRGRHRLAAGAGSVVAWAAVFLVPQVLRHGTGEFAIFLPRYAVHWPWAIGPFLLILAVTIAGARRGTRFLAKGTHVAKPLIALGLVLIFWGLTPGLKAPFWSSQTTFIYVDWPLLVATKITHGVRIALITAGAIALAVVVGLALARKLRGRSQPLGDEP